MPPITRWFIKSGMVYLLLGIVLALIAELPFVNTGALLLPVYWHMLVLGWITQVIMGVSIWMFPRKKRHRKRVQSKNAVFSFWFFNTGLILRFLTEPFIQVFPEQLWVTAIVILSALLLTTAVFFYLFEVWPRVFGRKKRKPKVKNDA